MSDERTARRFARVTEVLLAHEMPRADDFIELMRDIADSVAEGRKPTVLDWVMARAMAADVWRYDRETGDGAAVKRLVLEEPCYSAGKRNSFRDQLDRTQARQRCVESLKASKNMLHELRLGARGEQLPDNVVELPKITKSRKQ